MYWLTNPVFWAAVTEADYIITCVIFSVTCFHIHLDKTAVVLLSIVEMIFCMIWYLSNFFRRRHYSMVGGGGTGNVIRHYRNGVGSGKRDSASLEDLLLWSIIFSASTTLLGAIVFGIYHSGRDWSSLAITLPHSMFGIFNLMILASILYQSFVCM